MPFPNSSFAQIGKYTQIKLIGRGSGGKVYCAIDRLRALAVKEALPSQAGLIDTQNRFEKEARIQADFNHPNIIQVYHLEEDPQTHELYLVCEYANGGSLADHLKAGPLPEEQAIHITLDICAALEVVWSKGIVHRDIKPSNILLFTDDQGRISEAKLGDFGVAKHPGMQPSTLRGGSHPGTPEYMAPEQANITKPVDVRTDIYALGISLWEMLTCTHYKLERVHTPDPDLQSYNSKASPNIAEIIHRAVQDDPMQRYQTPQAMSADLQDVLGGRLLAAPPTIPLPPQAPSRRPGVGHTVVAILAVGSALALVGYGARHASGPLPTPAPTSAPTPPDVAGRGGSVLTAGLPEPTRVVLAPTVVTPPAPTDMPTTIPTFAPTDMPTTIPTVALTATPTPTLLMTTVLTFTSPAAGRQGIPLPLNQPGRYTLILTQEKNPTAGYWMIWDYIGLLQGNTPLWEIGESEAPPEAQAAYSEFCEPYFRPSECTSDFVVGTTSVQDFRYDINASDRPDATITFTITDQQANTTPTLVLSTLYASHDAIERFALKVSLVRAP